MSLISKQLKDLKKKTKNRIEWGVKDCIKSGKFTTSFVANAGQDTDITVECIEEVSKSMKRTGYHLEITKIDRSEQYSNVYISVVKNK